MAIENEMNRLSLIRYRLGLDDDEEEEEEESGQLIHLCFCLVVGYLLLCCCCCNAKNLLLSLFIHIEFDGVAALSATVQSTHHTTYVCLLVCFVCLLES